MEYEKLGFTNKMSEIWRKMQVTEYNQQNMQCKHTVYTLQ